MARRLLALPLSEEGKAWHVRRLDGKGAYFLVHVAGRVACIDAASGALLASAVAARAPVPVAREAALAIAGGGDAASAELVWEAMRRHALDVRPAVVGHTRRRRRIRRSARQGVAGFAA